MHIQKILIKHGKAKAKALSKILKETCVLEKRIGEEIITIKITYGSTVGMVANEEGKALGAIYSYLYTWQAFHLKPEVFKP